MEPEPDLTFGLYDLDSDIYEPFLEAQINTFPELGQVGARSIICGPESFTPDSRPLFGETPEVIITVISKSALHKIKFESGFLFNP